MSVSIDEVKHIASLARLGLDASQCASIALELSGILDHMQVLSRADTSAAPPNGSERPSAMPLREDVGPPIPLARLPNDFAPVMRDGFFLVPRLSTHEEIDSSS